MSNKILAHLPQFEPGISELSDVRGADFLPFALYALVDIPQERINNLADELEDDRTIGEDPDTIHLIRAAPGSISRQDNLSKTLAIHLQSCKTDKDALQYFPFGFLAAHDEDWNSNGILLVNVDFEEPYRVTAFRLRVGDVSNVCDTLRNDDNRAEAL